MLELFKVRWILTGWKKNILKVNDIVSLWCGEEFPVLEYFAQLFTLYSYSYYPWCVYSYQPRFILL